MIATDVGTQTCALPECDLQARPHGRYCSDIHAERGLAKQRNAICLRCEQPILDGAPTRPGLQRKYHLRCFWLTKQAATTTATPLARALEAERLSRGLTCAAFAGVIGISKQDYSSYRLGRAAHPSAATLAKIAAVLGDRMPEVETVEDERRRRIEAINASVERSALVARLKAARLTPAARLRLSEALRARAVSSTTRSKLSTVARARRAEGKNLIGTDPLAQRLLPRFRTVPVPALADVAAWADQAGAALGVKPSVILKAWGPFLERRRRAAGGRPANYARLAEVTALLEMWNAARAAAGRQRSRGNFYEWAADRLAEIEQYPLDAASLERWHKNAARQIRVKKPPLAGPPTA